MNEDYFEKSNKLIESIFSQAIKLLPKNSWQSLSLTVERKSSRSNIIKIEYVDDNNHTFLSSNEEINNQLAELINLVENTEKSKITGAVLKLDNTGKFDVKYNYS